MDSLTTKINTCGYAIIKNFLTAEEHSLLQETYKLTPTECSNNRLYEILVPRLLNLSVSIDPTIDTQVSGISYITTETFANDGYPYHQEHGSYYTWQQSLTYLNFYIPFIKENPSLSGLSIVPFDILQKNIPQYIDHIINKGACRYIPNNNITNVYDDELDSEWILPANIDNYKFSPELAEGDLLIMRGDLIHKTQDALTKRVAMSFRTAQGTFKISKKQMLHQSVFKNKTFESNKEYYNDLLKVFDFFNSDEVATYEIVDYMNKLRDMETE